MQNATEINAFSSITPGVTRDLMDLGKQYEALGAATPSAPGAISAQRKTLRELDANRAGSGRRY